MRDPIAMPQFDAARFDQIDVASPCSMRWDDMRGDDRARFCGACRLNVYDISALTRAEAESLIREHEGHLCVRFFRRADGTILTRNCPVGLRRVRHAVVRLAGSIAAVAILAVGAAAAMGERLRGRSVRICDTQPYVSLTRLLRTPPVIVPPPAPWQGQMLMGSIDLPLPASAAGGAAPAPLGPVDVSDPGLVTTPPTGQHSIGGRR